MRATPIKILVSESCGFSTEAAECLSQMGDLNLADLDRRGLLSQVKDADILWVRLRHLIDAEVMSSGARVRIIVTPTTGVNHIDLDEARRRNIRVISLRGESEFLNDVRATAELTLGLMLALLRNLGTAMAHVLDGGWNRDLFRGHELYQKTVGIVGYGRLGRIVARYLNAFGARLLVADPNLDLDSLDSYVELVRLEDLLRRSDIVTLHVALTESTQRFFGAEQFFAMKQGALFINTSRGELIDECALLESLESEQLGGAALDVLAHESSMGMSDHSLVAFARTHNNLLITPHIGGCTVESMEKTELFLAQKLLSERLSIDGYSS